MNETNSVKEMIAKVELSAEIARIALACPTCKGHASKAIERFKNQSKNQNQCAADGGHSLLPATNGLKDGLTNEYSTHEYT
jgi:hypothetical protein